MLIKIENNQGEVLVTRTSNIKAFLPPMKLTDPPKLWNFALEVENYDKKGSIKKRLFSSKYPTLQDCNLAYEAAMSMVHSYELAWMKYAHSSEIFLQGLSIPCQLVNWDKHKLENGNFILTPGFIPTLKI